MTVPVDARTVLTAWSAPPVPVATIAAAGVGYWWGVSRLAARGRAWPVERAAAFAGGLAMVVVALCSGVAHYDTSVFALHVVQHLLLSMVAPPLLALGAPVTLALQASSRPVQERLVAVLHSRVITVVTHPIVVLVVFGGSLIALYFTPVYELSLRHAWVHDLVHMHFLVAGMLFFWPVVGLDPVRWRLPFGARMLYVLVALPFHSIVGLALTSSRQAMWPGWHTVADQQAGGGALMLGGDLVTIAVFGIVFWQWALWEERAAARSSSG